MSVSGIMIPGIKPGIYRIIKSFTQTSADMAIKSMTPVYPPCVTINLEMKDNRIESRLFSVSFSGIDKMDKAGCFFDNAKSDWLADKNGQSRS